MKKRLFVLLLVIWFVGCTLATMHSSAQDIPQPRAFQVQDLYAEIGQLHIQVNRLNEYVQTLTVEIKQLQAENKALKQKGEAPQP